MLFHCWVRQTPDIGNGTKFNGDGLRVRRWLAQLRISTLVPVYFPAKGIVIQCPDLSFGFRQLAEEPLKF